MPNGIKLNKIEDLKRSMLNCNVFSVYDYDCLSMQELLCTFFEKINQCVDVTNKTVVLVDWLVEQGLKEEVAKKLESWFADGTLANIINEVIFKELNNKVLLNTRAITNLENNFTEYKNTNDARVNKIRHELDSVYVFSDSFFTLQQAHDEVVRRGGGTLVINKDYDLDVPFMWDCSKVIIEGHGHKIESTVNRPVVNVISSETKGKPYYQAQISFSNLKLKGNKQSSALYLNSNDPNKAISHVTFRNVSIENTKKAIDVGNSVYLLKFVDCDIFNNENIITVGSTVTDTGENIQFRGCAIYNNTGGFIVNNGNCDIFLDSCSIDYNEVNSVVELNNGKMYFNNCHFEHDARKFGSNVPFVVRGDAGQLFINNSLIMFSHQQDTNLANIFFVSGGNSTITLTNNFLFGCKTTSQYLCGGDGRMIMRGNRVNIVPECNLAIHPSITTSACGSMSGDRLPDIYLTEDASEINEIKTIGTNGKIEIDKVKYLKFGRSIKVSKTSGGGSPFAIRAIFPIDKMSINNVRLQLAKASGSGTLNITFGYCVPNKGQDYDEVKGTLNKDLGGGDWELIEQTMMTSPMWATHGFVNIATSNAANIVFNIGEIVSNSI